MGQNERNRLIELLRRLARLPEDGAPVLSLYLDTLRDSGRKRDETRVFIKSRLRQAAALHPSGHPWHDSVAADIERVQRVVEEVQAPSAVAAGQGLALFASSGRGLWERIATPRPFENQLIVRRTPHLVQFARLIDDTQTAVLCQVDSREARILEFALGGLSAEARIENPDLPRRHHQGGWSQMRYQRHVDWEREKHVREVADVFVRVADQDPKARLFLAGPMEPLTFLRNALPKRILERNPTDLSLQRDAEMPDLVQAVLAGVDAQERQDEIRAVRRTIEEALAGGLAAGGVEEVAVAASAGAVSKLLILRDLSLAGWRCVAGCRIGAGEPPDVCPSCRGKTAACDLYARLVERTLAGGGEVDVVHDSEMLRAAGGVAAQIRFRV